MVSDIFNLRGVCCVSERSFGGAGWSGEIIAEPFIFEIAFGTDTIHLCGRLECIQRRFRLALTKVLICRMVTLSVGTCTGAFQKKVKCSKVKLSLFMS